MASAKFSMKKPNEIEGAKSLMGALVRMKPKAHEDMKLGQQAPKKKKKRPSKSTR